MMDHDQQPGLIASHVAKTLESFQNFEGALSKAAKSSDVSEGAALNEFPLQIENSFTRFKMWVGDQVAHRSGRFSLDYRLREAEHLQKQVIYLLTDICESLHTAASLVNDGPSFLEKNQKEREDGISQDNDSHSSLPDSDDDDESDVCDEGPTSSLLTLSSDIGEAIDCLLRLSVAIANPAPLERFRKFGAGPSEDISFYESCDIAYAKDNFPIITDELARALGKFITHRRQFFKYRHHERLASGEEPVISDKETETCHTEVFAATVTSSLPERSKTLDNLDTHAFVENESIRADAGMWQMSYVTPACDWRLPPRPSAAEYDDIFNCPFCCRKISAKTDAAWEQHVFGDLRPYTCLFSECIESNLDFDRHESWQSHLLKYHWRSWSCPFKCQQPFSAAAELSRHIRENHLPTGTEEDIKSIAALGERDAPNNISHPCPLCEYSIKGLAEYIDHVGSHLEQLALFALPSLETEHLGSKTRSEKSNYKPEVGADSPQRFSATPPSALGAHTTPSFEPPGKGKEAAVSNDAMSDIGSSDLLEPSLGKKAVRRDSWSEDIKVEPPVATTPDVPALEQAIQDAVEMCNVAQMEREEAILKWNPAQSQREIVVGTKKESKEEPAMDYPGNNPMPAHSMSRWYPVSHDFTPSPPPSPPEAPEAGHPQRISYFPPDHSVPGPVLQSTDYLAHSTPAIPQSTRYYAPGGSRAVVSQSQIHYSMPTHPQSTWYGRPGCSEPAPLQPPTGYSGYYMPQQHHPVTQAAALGSTGEAPVSCVYPGCTSRPFKRRADLERHVRYTHSTESNKDAYLCDYRRCPREGEPFHRRDHLRDHLREYHGEDISKRGAPSDMGSGATTWWRCPRCLTRVYVSKHGYECPDCKSEGKRRS